MSTHHCCRLSGAAAGAGDCMCPAAKHCCMAVIWCECCLVGVEIAHSVMFKVLMDLLPRGWVVLSPADLCVLVACHVQPLRVYVSLSDWCPLHACPELLCQFMCACCLSVCCCVLPCMCGCAPCCCCCCGKASRGRHVDWCHAQEVVHWTGVV